MFSVFVAIPSDVAIEGLVSCIEADESDSESSIIQKKRTVTMTTIYFSFRLICKSIFFLQM